jgi:hypothetical protein
VNDLEKKKKKKKKKKRKRKKKKETLNESDILKVIYQYITHDINSSKSYKYNE